MTTKISARVIEDSVGPTGARLTTFVLTYPRFIHSEFLTARVFSRNSASSRAIPTWKMIKAVLSDPATPVSWGSAKAGMQAGPELAGARRYLARSVWLLSRLAAAAACWSLTKVGCHKQVANRVIEPYAWMTTLVTATDWGNFFNLRAHPDAQPEFQALAYEMLEAYVRSWPRELAAGEWHLPFSDQLILQLGLEKCLKVSTARAARLSYLTFDGKIDVDKDCELHDRLLASGHMSPFEHAAEAMPDDTHYGNLRGFRQYRKLLPNENRVHFEPEALLRGRINANNHLGKVA